MALENLTPTTELEALNLMLVSIGESPVDSVDAVQQDVETAIQLLRENSKEVQTWGWRFNTEFELPIAEADQIVWNEYDGTTEDIRVFLPPSGVASWKLSETPGQHLLDVATFPSKQYDAGAGVGVPVIYDRARNRDGFPVGEREYLFLDVVYLRDFTDLPEAARKFIAIRAARQYATRQLGDADRGRVLGSDEIQAWRLMKRDPQCRKQDRYNFNQNADVARVHRGRVPGPVGVMTDRRNWK